MPGDPRFESVVKYNEEGLVLFREWVAFLKKRKDVEAEYYKNLQKLCRSFTTSMAKKTQSLHQAKKGSLDNLGGGNSGSSLNIAKEKITPSDTTIWEAVLESVEETCNLVNHREKMVTTLNQVIETATQAIKSLEQRRKELIDEEAKETKALQETYTLLKKSKTDFDELQKVADDANEKNIQAMNNPGAKEKELEKLQTKATQTSDKASEARKAWLDREDASKNAQEHYYRDVLPRLLNNFVAKENERLQMMKTLVCKYGDMESFFLSDASVISVIMNEKLTRIDVEEDLQDFIDDHFEDDSQGANTSVRSLINPVKTGRVLRHSVDSDWKSRYLVLMGDERLLYFFEQEDSLKPKGVVDMKKTFVHSIDDSLYDRPNCFHLHEKNFEGSDRIVSIEAETSEEKMEWLRALKAYDASRTPETVGFLNNREVRHIKSVQLMVLEARDLTKHDIMRKSLDPFCLIEMNGIKFAKTVTKLNTTTPFWGESFVFDDTQPYLKSLTVLIFSQNRIRIKGDSQEIAKLVVPFDSLEPGVTKEEWFNLVGPKYIEVEDGTLIPAKNDSKTDFGAIRLKITLMIEKVLPAHQYDNLWQFVNTDDLVNLDAIANALPKKKPDIAATVLKICNSISIMEGLHFLQRVTCKEINSTDDPNIIFRGNSVATKALDVYMKMVGMTYLHNTLKKILAGVYKDTQSCEVDPTRLDKSDDIKRNWKRLIALVTQIWDTIYNSADKCPWELKFVFQSLGKDVMTKFNDERVKHTSISGFIFLRFFCPAILDPKLFGMATGHPDNNTARTLTLVAKTLQNLANLVEFGGKEPYMAEMNNFITSHLDAAKNCIEKFSTPPNPLPTVGSAKLTIDKDREFAALYRLAKEAVISPEVGHTSTEENFVAPPWASDIAQLAPILTTLDEQYQLSHFTDVASAVSPPTSPRHDRSFTSGIDFGGDGVVSPSPPAMANVPIPLIRSKSRSSKNLPQLPPVPSSSPPLGPPSAIAGISPASSTSSLASEDMFVVAALAAASEAVKHQSATIADSPPVSEPSSSPQKPPVPALRTSGKIEPPPPPPKGKFVAVPRSETSSSAAAPMVITSPLPQKPLFLRPSPSQPPTASTTPTTTTATSNTSSSSGKSFFGLGRKQPPPPPVAAPGNDLPPPPSVIPRSKSISAAPGSNPLMKELSERQQHQH